MQEKTSSCFYKHLPLEKWQNLILESIVFKWTLMFSIQLTFERSIKTFWTLMLTSFPSTGIKNFNTVSRHMREYLKYYWTELIKTSVMESRRQRCISGKYKWYKPLWICCMTNKLLHAYTVVTSYIYLLFKYQTFKKGLYQMSGFVEGVDWLGTKTTYHIPSREWRISHLTSAM